MAVPLSVWIIATLFSGGVVAYFIRQLTERLKLRIALKAEINNMDGLESCAETMESRSRDPSDDPLKPSEVPPEGAIPTKVYDANVGRLGLLGTESLEEVISFYSRVFYYKSVIRDVRSHEEVPEPDQEELYDSIGDLITARESLLGSPLDRLFE